MSSTNCNEHDMYIYWIMKLNQGLCLMMNCDDLNDDEI
jgi:hypothetical protein